MSIILESGEKISRSPLNNSTSKMMFSFPKARRFQERRGLYSNQIYNLPEVKSQRSTSLGYGNKYDFTKNGRFIKAPYYNIPSDFNTQKPHSPAYTFGISRDYYQKVFNGSSNYVDKNVPGPGQYDYLKPTGQESLKFSLYGRREIIDAKIKQKSPGPGQYVHVSIQPSGKYPISSLRNTTNIVWSNSKSNRFVQKINLQPGPGKYNINNFFNGTGSLFNSKYKSNLGKSISGRFGHMYDSKSLSTPGPGSYRVFSEFGQYQSKDITNEKKQPSNIKTFYSATGGEKNKDYNSTLGHRLSSSLGFKIQNKDNFNSDYKPDEKKPQATYVNNYPDKKIEPETTQGKKIILSNPVNKSKSQLKEPESSRELDNRIIDNNAEIINKTKQQLTEQNENNENMYDENAFEEEKFEESIHREDQDELNDQEEDQIQNQEEDQINDQINEHVELSHHIDQSINKSIEVEAFNPKGKRDSEIIHQEVKKFVDDLFTSNKPLNKNMGTDEIIQYAEKAADSLDL